MNEPKGSLWRQWDLHFHTPASFDYQNKGITDEQIIQGLRDAGLSAVAITDHHVIDVARIKHLQALAGNDLLILPGIELRSELGGGESVHFIGIFPQDCDLDSIWTKLSGQLEITPADIKKKGDDKVYCDFEESAQIIHTLGGIVSVHAGGKSNSIENVRNTEPVKYAIKSDLANNSIDIFEVGKKTDIDEYREIVFPYLKRNYALILCSDNHNILEYARKEKLWIKADLTYAGLSQVINEPIDRCFVGDIPPKLECVRLNKTKYVRSVSIHRKPESQLQETWFDNDIELNSGLVAIIGNKGKGKSALADTLGILGNTRQSDAFSFLSTKNFRNPKENKAKSFQATATWEDGTTLTIGLSDEIDLTKPELIKYIPQNFLELICNEVGGTSETHFDHELKKVIFSHVSEPERLGKDSLEALLTYQTSEAETKIRTLQQELYEINKTIVSYCDKLEPVYKQTLSNALAFKQHELQSHLTTKPEEKQKPNSESQASTESVDTAKRIETIKIEQIKLEALFKVSQAEQARLILSLAQLEKMSARLNQINDTIDGFRETNRADYTNAGINIDSVLTFNINRKPIDNKRMELLESKTKIDAILDPSTPAGYPTQLKELTTQLVALQAKLDEPNKMYQAYLGALDQWNKRVDQINGNEETPETILYIQKTLRDLDEIPALLAKAKDTRSAKTKQIHTEILNLVEQYRKLYTPVHQFIHERPLARDKFNLNFEVTVIDTGFTNGLLSLISQRAAGTFSGIEEGERAVNDILARHDFNTEKGMRAFLTEIVDSIENDRRPGCGGPVNVKQLMRKGQDVGALYDFVFSLSYLKPRYILRMGAKELYQLSPGERGTLLLVFYLLVDKGDIPLMIDQPEENLDNQTVFELLVPCIKEAKERRQIFIVTHNPNLAVVCDAEQVICASLNKSDNYKMTYTSGAIESPVINSAIVDILEGTRPAFDNRDSKYFRKMGP